MTPIRVLVVDDQRLIREGIASLLSIEPDILVVGTASEGSAAVAQAVETEADVVLMDVRMPTMDGVAATAQLRELRPACRVLMLTTFDDEEYVVQATRAGAIGYLLKDLPAADLARAIRLAHAGVAQHDPAAIQRLMSALNRIEPVPPDRAPTGVASPAPLPSAVASASRENASPPRSTGKTPPCAAATGGPSHRYRRATAMR
jgi:DNA-binding NarL/FixJ family response regulator